MASPLYAFVAPALAAALVPLPDDPYFASGDLKHPSHAESEIHGPEGVSFLADIRQILVDRKTRLER